MKFNLGQLESRLQTLIEVHLLNFLLGVQKDGRIAEQLAAAMHENMVEVEGKKVAPYFYVLTARPELIDSWQADTELIDGFLKILETVAKEGGFTFATTPKISFAPNASLSGNDVSVTASQAPVSLAETQGMETDAKENEELENEMPSNAFLIVHGTKVFPLTKSTIDIGRRIENDLTIDDPRVSRNHAQLRSIKGRFVIFDLNSTGGIFVNSQRTSQTILYPGDVISLAGVSLIFGQDNPPTRADQSETSPLPSPAHDDRTTAIVRDTAIFRKSKTK